MRPLQSETPSPLEREPALCPLTGLFLPGRPCPCSETGLALEGECALVGLGCGQVQHLRCVRPLPALPLPTPSLTPRPLRRHLPLVSLCLSSLITLMDHLCGCRWAINQF